MSEIEPMQGKGAGIDRRALIKRAAAAGAVAWTAPIIVESFTSPAAAQTGQISVTALQSNTSTTDATTYTNLVTYTGTSGATVLILLASCGDGAARTVSSIAGTTATLVKELNYSGNFSIHAFRASGTGVSQTISVTFSGACKNCGVSVVEIAGNNTTTPIAEANPNTGNDNAPVGVLAAVTAGNGEVILFGQDELGSFGPPGSFSELHDVQIDDGMTNEDHKFMSCWSATAVTSATASSTTSAPWGSIAMEITLA